MAKPYQLIDHTADIGIRVIGEDLEDLLFKAGYALLDLIVGDLESLEGDQEVVLEVRGSDVETMFVNWLRELLYLFEVKRFISLKFRFLDPWDEWCRVRCHGTFYRPGEQRLNMEIKAVTYHRLKVEEQPDGRWLAQVIFDI